MADWIKDKEELKVLHTTEDPKEANWAELPISGCSQDQTISHALDQARRPHHSRKSASSHIRLDKAGSI